MHTGGYKLVGRITYMGHTTYWSHILYLILANGISELFEGSAIFHVYIAT
jgi:hypothetical protein